MKRTSSLLAVCATGAVALASCGGGGSSTAVAPASHPIQAITKIPAPSAAKVVYGTATLSIKLPATVTAKNAAAAHVHTAAGSRTPAYVNPQSGAVLDIFVDGTLAQNIDNVTPNDSYTIQPTSNGIQNVTVPLYSQSTNRLVVVEWDSSSRNVALAGGEADAGTFTAGTGVNLSLTMNINATSIGIIDLHNQSDPEVMTGQSYHGLAGSCGGATALSSFGLFITDPTGAFVPIAGSGGTGSVTAAGTPDAGGTSSIAQSQLGTFQVAWDASCTKGVSITATGVNPSAAFADASNFGAPNNTYNYYYCYYYGECSNLGPYYGVWLNANVYQNQPYNLTNYFTSSPTLTASADLLPT
jgi:hypothetical protein